MPISKETKTLPYRPRLLSALLKVNRRVRSAQTKAPPLRRGFHPFYTSSVSGPDLAGLDRRPAGHLGRASVCRPAAVGLASDRHPAAQADCPVAAGLASGW